MMFRASQKGHRLIKNGFCHLAGKQTEQRQRQSCQPQCRGRGRGEILPVLIIFFLPGGILVFKDEEAEIEFCHIGSCQPAGEEEQFYVKGVGPGAGFGFGGIFENGLVNQGFGQVPVQKRESDDAKVSSQKADVQKRLLPAEPAQPVERIYACE